MLVGTTTSCSRSPRRAPEADRICDRPLSIGIRAASRVDPHLPEIRHVYRRVTAPMRPSPVALVLCALLVTTGCLGVLRPAPSGPGAEAVVEEAVAVGSSVETYRVRSDLHAVGTVDGDRRELGASTTGVVDRAERESMLRVEREEATRRVYVIGNTTYTECAPPWSGWGREVHEELDDDWSGHDPLGRQLTLLAESPVVWVGNETLRGTAVHVVRAHPSDRTLTRFSENRGPLIPVFGPRIRNTTFTAWIAEDSARILRARLAFELRTDETTVESRMTTSFSGYGADVEISLPAEATEDPFRRGCPGS